MDQSEPYWLTPNNEIVGDNIRWPGWPEARIVSNWIYAWSEAILGHNEILPEHLVYVTKERALLRPRLASAWHGEKPWCHFPPPDPLARAATAPLFVTAAYRFDQVNGYPGEPEVPQVTLQIFDAVNGSLVARLYIDNDIYEPAEVQVDCMRSTLYLREKAAAQRICRWSVCET